MKYHFNERIMPHETSAKWHWYLDDEDVIPMWVADMDFAAPVEVKRELKKRIDEGVFGYTIEPDSYFDAIIQWQGINFGWKLDREWIVSSPGVITSLNVTIQAFSSPGDNILVQTPVYHSFYDCVFINNRNIIKNPLKLVEDQYEIDFDDLEQVLRKHDVKIFLLCNPHNPTGKVYKDSELRQLATLCRDYNVLMIADEIHQDLIYSEYQHTTLGLLTNLYDNIVVLNSPTKSFNMAGLKVSNTIIPSTQLREKYILQRKKNGPTSINLFGILACEVAYAGGETWLRQVMGYIENNRNYALQYLKSFLPELRAIAPQGTYFLWVDCSNLCLVGSELEDFFIKRARIRVSNGVTFGSEGERFIRLNIACPFKLLEKALYSLHNAVRSR